MYINYFVEISDRLVGIMFVAVIMNVGLIMMHLFLSAFVVL